MTLDGQGGPSVTTRVHRRGGKRIQEGNVTTEAEVGVTQSREPRNAGGLQRLEDVKNQSSPRAFRRSIKTLETP